MWLFNEFLSGHMGISGIEILFSDPYLIFKTFEKECKEIFSPVWFQNWTVVGTMCPGSLSTQYFSKITVLSCVCVCVCVSMYVGHEHLYIFLDI